MDCGKDANGESIIRQQDMHMDEAVFVEFVEEFWYIGDCSLHEESDEYIPNHLFNAYLDMYNEKEKEIA